MQHKYSSIFILTAVWIGMMLSTSSKAFASLPRNTEDSTKTLVQKPSKSAIVDTRNNRPQDINKTLSNVKVFPNPVVDQINLAFQLNKDSKVTIKIMDALGNEITTLLSQRLTAGDQSHGFMINSKLNCGYYFIRIMAGSETIVKRIQVL